MKLDVAPEKAMALPFVLAWLMLLVLYGVSLGTAFLGLGIWTPVVEFGIAAIGVAVMFIVFMRLKGPPSLKWIFAGSGFFWLLFLYGLSMMDYASRRGWPTFSH